MTADERVSIEFAPLACADMKIANFSGTSEPGSTQIVREPWPGLVAKLSTSISLRAVDETEPIGSTLSSLKVYGVPLTGDRSSKIAIERGVVGFWRRYR